MKNKTNRRICPQCGPVDSSSEHCEWCSQPLTQIDESRRSEIELELIRVAAHGYRLLFFIACVIIITHFLGHFFGLL